MKLFSTLALIALYSCSSGPRSDKHIDLETPPVIKKDAFVKEKQLKNSEVKDFYEGNAKALSPALQDETVDRFSSDEQAQFVDDADPLLQMTLKCNEGDYDEAFKIANANFNRYQKVATYWNVVANCHLNRGAYRKSLLFYNKALEVQKNYVPALNNIGVMYSRQGQYQKAQVAFERAYNQSKFSKTPRYNLAKLYLSYGLAEQAMPILKGLLASHPQDVDLLNAVGSGQFLLSDYQSALATFQQIPKDLWSNAEIGLNIAFTMKKLNRGPEAKKVFLDIQSPGNNELKRYYTSVGKILGENE